MLNNNTVYDDQSADSSNPSALQTQQTQHLEVAQALPMRLQTLDLARHTVIAPDEKRYVVGTFDDTRVGNGYVTDVYPQQNGYLTLVRLILAHFSSPSPQEAMKRHMAIIEAIQDGRIDELHAK
jgi:hypothetical protein